MQPIRLKTTALLAIGVSALALTMPAYAQDAIDGEGGDIVVTARKARERLQDVPISVNALSGDQLRDRGAVDVKDILRSVPGLSFSGTERGLGNYNIRGISTVASAPTVGIYLDDISLVTIATTFSGAFDPVFFDMERIEVLKGPQGTLYGGSSMGGAIKYVSARPKINETEGSAAAGLASTAHGSASYNAEAVINLPLVTDKLAVRGGIYYRHDGGYIDNIAGGTVTNSRYSSTASPTYTPQTQNSLSTRSKSNQNDAETYVGRLSLLWQPDETWSIRPAAFYQKYKLANPGQFFLGLPELTSSFRLRQPTTDKTGVYSLDITKDLGGVQATSLTAYFDRKFDFVRDYSFFIGGLVPPLFALNSNNLSASHTKTFSQELRLASNNGPDARLTWIAGLYYSNQDDNLYQIVTTPGATPVIGTETGYLGDTTTKTKQYSAFGEATYKILDNLDITAGVRLFQIKQTVDLLGDGPFNGGLTQVVGRKSNEKGVNPKVGVSFKATKDNLVYASAAKGFRPGGPNRFQINPVLCATDLAQLGLTKAPDTFDSDNLWSYELGTKNQFGNTVMFNGAVFYTDWKKIQQQIGLSSCGFAFTGNAGVAHVKGAEGEARINLTREFQIGGTATYSDAKIVSAAFGTTAQSGDQVLAVPKWMLSSFASYSVTVADGWRGQVRGEYQYQSKSRRQFNRVNSVVFPNGGGTVPNRAEFREGYQVVNAFASVGDGTTEFRLYMNNIFDVTPLIDTDLTIGSDRSTTIRPRTIGLEVRRKF